MTKTVIYSKTYSSTVSLDDGTSSNFKVTSAKKTTTKFKIKSKKTKTLTIKIKKGIKSYKKGNYLIVTQKTTKKGWIYIDVVLIGKYEEFTLKYKVKNHYKKNGKWKWEKKWTNVPLNNYFTSNHYKSIKLDKIKIQYTQYSFKKNQIRS